MSTEIHALQRSERTVALVIDVPELDFFPTDCVETRPLRLTSKPLRADRCAVRTTTAMNAQSEYRELIDRITHANQGVRVFDPRSVLCDDQWCDAMRGGRLIYRDRQHLTVAGSLLVSAALLRWLES